MSIHPYVVELEIAANLVRSVGNTKMLLALSLVLAWAQLRVEPAGAHLSSRDHQENQISTEQFKLASQPRGFVLQFVSKGKTKRVTIPQSWLIPPEEEKDEESNYVSSFHYDKAVSSFPIGNGRIGLHLSSYAIQNEGTAQAAAGRDVFLIFDPGSSGVFRGGIERGVTKQRVRFLGCSAASAEHYFLADVDGDGLIDIGVVKEEIRCLEKREAGVDTVRPIYKRHAPVWYVFKGGAWQFSPNFSAMFPDHYVELPLIGMDRSPVDFVGCSVWHTCDRGNWPVGEGD